MIVLFVLVIMGSTGALLSAENTPDEQTSPDNKEAVDCPQQTGAHIEVINLKHVKAEDVSAALAPLFSDSAKIIPFEPSNSIMVKEEGQQCRDPE